MVEFLRDQPVSFFIWANPFFWLFVFSPAIVFWLRREKTELDALSLSAFLSLGVSWAMALVFVFGTDAFLWSLAHARRPIPAAWESFLEEDGARNVFVLLLGWTYGLVPLLLWSPAIAFAHYVRRLRKRRGHLSPPAA